MSLNKIFLTGRLTRDPELRHTQNGTAVAAFSLAVDRDFKDKATGEKAADFVDITAWGHTGEFVARNFGKGSAMTVVGRLQMRDWTDKDGNKRWSAEVVVETVYFAGERRSVFGDSLPTGAEKTARAGDFRSLNDDNGEELPF